MLLLFYAGSGCVGRTVQRMLRIMLLLLSSTVVQGGASKNRVKGGFGKRKSSFGITKKSPINLVCYQKYPSELQSCTCSWEAGEESQEANYTLGYCNNRKIRKCFTFDAMKQTYHNIPQGQVYFSESITLWVEANEFGDIYRSMNVTVLLDNVLKLDPPERTNVKFTKYDSNLKMEWDRVKYNSETTLLLKEIQYMKWRTSHWLNVDNFNCYNTDSEEGMKKEYCSLDMEGNQAYYVQIRQKFEEGIWSEWSEPVFVPADIVHSPEISYTLGKLNRSGRRNLVLSWMSPGEEHGDVIYEINLNLLPCSLRIEKNSTGGTSEILEISGAAYNLTVVPFNEAGRGPPWSSIIGEDTTKVFSGTISLAEYRNLKLQWEGKKRKKAHYCMVWKPTAIREALSRCSRGNSSAEANLSVDEFIPMQCYEITVHKYMSEMPIMERTLGTIYFTNSLSLGPANLTLINITAKSVLLKWDRFEPSKCERLLQTWVIITTDHEKNLSKESYLNASVTQYFIANLSSGCLYTFEIKGITIFGEETGSIRKSVITLRTDLNIDDWLLAAICVGILLGFVGVGGFCYFGIKRFRISLCPVVPDPTDSSATQFFPFDRKYVQCPMTLFHPNSENGPLVPLSVEPQTEVDSPKVVVKEHSINHWLQMEERSEKDLVFTVEIEPELAFQYKRQMRQMSLESDKEG